VTPDESASGQTYASLALRSGQLMRAKARTRTAAGIVLDAGALIARQFLRSEEVEIVPLDDQLARSCRELCAATNSPDVIDAAA